MPEWIWHWSGYAVALLACVGVAWALFWDRSRGWKRCRRCWYDMAGVPTEPGDLPAACPECGRAHAKPRHLTRTRRRWGRAAVLGLVMVVGGYGLWAVPRVQDEGWWGLAPNVILFCVYPERDWYVAREPRIETTAQLPVAVIERLVKQEQAAAAFQARANVRVLASRDHSVFDRLVFRLMLYLRSDETNDREVVVVALDRLADRWSYGWQALSGRRLAARCDEAYRLVFDLAMTEAHGVYWPGSVSQISNAKFGETAVYWGTPDEVRAVRTVASGLDRRKFDDDDWLAVDMSEFYTFENMLLTAEMAEQHPEWFEWHSVGDEYADGYYVSHDIGAGIFETLADCTGWEIWSSSGGIEARHWVHGDRVLIFAAHPDVRRRIQTCIDALELPLPELE